MDRNELATAIPQAWGMFQLFLPGLMSISRENQSEAKFRQAETRAFVFSLLLSIGLSGVKGTMTPLVGWSIGVPIMALLYEWSYNNVELTF